MIEFEIDGEFRQVEDVCCALEEVIHQMRQGYTGGYLGDCSWTISGDEEITCTCSDALEPHFHCGECDCVLKDTDDLDLSGELCDSCFEKRG